MTAPTAARGGEHLPTGWARWCWPILWCVLAVVVLGLLAMYVFPTRTWIDQGRHIDSAEASLAELQAEREVLQARLDALDSDAEIEELAREQFGLVLPGEEAYAVLPAAEPPVDLPTLWPFGDVDAPAETASATPGVVVEDNQLAP